MTQTPKGKWLLAATIAAYCLIGVEIIIMITPFALYFYSVYGPVLEFLARAPMLGWTTEFFLPHMVFPDDPIILAISYLQILLVVGLLLFFSAAIPLYYGRFTGKGVVSFGFYSRIRHPQYLFLAISGFGLLLYWPRFIILLFYVTMLFVYYLLARNEEWRMKQSSPGAYEEYMRQTPMFLPGEPGGRIYRAVFGWIQPKWLGLTVAYGVSLVLAVFLAMGVRTYCVKQLPTVRDGAMTLLPVFPRPAAEVRELYDKVMANEKVRELVQEKAHANLTYVFPGDFFLTALVTEEERRFSQDVIERFPEVLEWHQHKFRGGLGRFFKIFYNFVSTLGTMDTNYDVERLVFVRVSDEEGGRPLQSERLFEVGTTRTPVLIVDVDAEDHRLLTVMRTSENHKWGTMPMPSF